MANFYNDKCGVSPSLITCFNFKWGISFRLKINKD